MSCRFLSLFKNEIEVVCKYGSDLTLFFPLLSTVHRITGTGFVGSLDWKLNSAVLAIGSRLDKAMIVRIKPAEGAGSGTGRQLQSEILHSIKRPNWVNAVAFSPGGIIFAMGDAGGQLSIYNYEERPNKQVQVNIMASFTMEDSILCLSFSPDGKWLYTGGEDFRVSLLNHESCSSKCSLFNRTSGKMFGASIV